MSLEDLSPKEHAEKAGIFVNGEIKSFRRVTEVQPGHDIIGAEQVPSTRSLITNDANAPRDELNEADLLREASRLQQILVKIHELQNLLKTSEADSRLIIQNQIDDLQQQVEAIYVSTPQIVGSTQIGERYRYYQLEDVEGYYDELTPDPSKEVFGLTSVYVTTPAIYTDYYEVILKGKLSFDNPNEPSI